MSACKQVLLQLPEFVAGDLSPLAMAALRNHLQSCHGCRQEASLHLQARRALGSLVSLPGVDDGFFADLHGEVMQRIAAHAGPPVADSGRWRRFVGAAAAVALFGLGVWFVQVQGRGGMLLREVRPAAAALPMPMPWAGSSALHELGLFDYGDASEVESSAPFTQGMMGRAMLPHFVEVDLLGQTTLMLETRTPGGRVAEPMPKTGTPAAGPSMAKARPR
jgi:hypothetical protein